MNKRKMIEWIGLGMMGISSRTMWCVLMGVSVVDYVDCPHDIADLDYCIRMVRNGEVTKEDLRKVKESYAWYAPFIDNWDEIVSLYDNGKSEELNDGVFELCQFSHQTRYKHKTEMLANALRSEKM